MNFEHVIGLGVAGNFAGHLEQAGEAKDFVAVKVADAVAPKAIFPFYVPSADAGFLQTYHCRATILCRQQMLITCKLSPKWRCCVIFTIKMG